MRNADAYALYELLLLTPVVEGISRCSTAKDDAARQRPRIESRSQQTFILIYK